MTFGLRGGLGPYKYSLINSLRRLPISKPVYPSHSYGTLNLSASQNDASPRVAALNGCALDPEVRASFWTLRRRVRLSLPCFDERVLGKPRIQWDAPHPATFAQEGMAVGIGDWISANENCGTSAGSK